MRSNGHWCSGCVQRSQWKRSFTVVGKVSMSTEVVEFLRCDVKPVEIGSSHDLVVLESLGDSDEGFVSMSYLVSFDTTNSNVVFNVHKAFNC